MKPRVKRVEALPEYKLCVQFSNDELGIFDCSHLRDFGVFKEFRDEGYFRRVVQIWEAPPNLPL